MHYLSPVEFMKAIQFYDIKKIDQVYDRLETHFNSTKDFAVERNKEDVSLFNEVVKYIRQRVKKASNYIIWSPPRDQ